MIGRRGVQMKCIYCGNEGTKVLDSRAVNETNAIRRRRECEKCGKRWTTYETVDTVPIMVVKKNTGIEPFNKARIVEDLIKACEKRPVGLDELEKIADKIEKTLIDRDISHVPTLEIGEMVLDELKPLDEISYIKFAILLYNFNSGSELKEFIDA